MAKYDAMNIENDELRATCHTACVKNAIAPWAVSDAPRSASIRGKIMERPMGTPCKVYNSNNLQLCARCARRVEIRPNCISFRTESHVYFLGSCCPKQTLAVSFATRGDLTDHGKEQPTYIYDMTDNQNVITIEVLDDLISIDPFRSSFLTSDFAITAPFLKSSPKST